MCSSYVVSASTELGVLGSYCVYVCVCVISMGTELCVLQLQAYVQQTVYVAIKFVMLYVL